MNFSNTLQSIENIRISQSVKVQPFIGLKIIVFSNTGSSDYFYLASLQTTSTAPHDKRLVIMTNRGKSELPRFIFHQDRFWPPLLQTTCINPHHHPRHTPTIYTPTPFHTEYRTLRTTLRGKLGNGEHLFLKA